MCIYVDILIITNIYINFFILKAVSKITHNHISGLKCTFAAALGSLFSLIILLPSLNSLLLLLVRIFSAAVMVLAAFHGKSISELYKIGLVFFSVCLLFAGVEYAVAGFIGENNSLWHNSVLYVNISLLTLIISTIAAYVILCIFRRFLDGNKDFDGDFTLIIVNGDKKISVKAVCDSCNNLIDFFSGRPVVICSKSLIEPLFEEKVLEYVVASAENKALKGWRNIPFSTINSGGVMPSFKPAAVYIKNNESGDVKEIDAYIGVAAQELEYAVFNPKILLKG